MAVVTTGTRSLVSGLLFADGLLLYATFGVFITTRGHNRLHRPAGALLAVLFVLAIAGAVVWESFDTFASA